MNLTPLTAEEQRLVSVATERLCDVADRGHAVVAAALTSDGGTVFGVDLASRKSGICAEPGALSAARLAGVDVRVVVAVCRVVETGEDLVISPCGACRELLVTQDPGCRVVVPTPDGLRTAAARDLFPWPGVLDQAP